MLLQQNVTSQEIVIVDQSENVEQISLDQVAEWKRCGNVRVFRQLERNASAARNLGALNATGDVLLFLDDDIQIGPSFLTNHLRHYIDQNVTGVAGQILEGDRAVASTRPTGLLPELEWLTFPKNFGFRCRTSWMASGNVSVRRDIYLKLGGMDENYIRGAFREESDFAMRYLRAGYDFVFDPEASIYHLGLSASTGGSRRRGWWQCSNHFFGFWYFVFGFTTLKTFPIHIWWWLRSHVLSPKRWLRLDIVIVQLCQWIAMIPVALRRRISGPKLLSYTIEIRPLGEPAHSNVYCATRRSSNGNRP